MPQISSRSPSPETDPSAVILESSDDDHISVSSEEEKTYSKIKKGLVQPKLESFFKKDVVEIKKEVESNDKKLSPIKVRVGAHFVVKFFSYTDLLLPLYLFKA